MNKGTVKIILVFAMLCLIWGSTWLAIRLSLGSLSPMFSSGFRFIAAAIFVFIVMKLQGITMQRDKLSVRLYILQGFFAFAIPFSLVYWSEQYIPSGLAAVLFAVYPFSVALFSYFAIPNEHIGPYKITGMILGFTGIVIIFWDDIGGNLTSYLLGMIAMVCSGVMQAGMAVTIKKYGHHLNPLSMNLIPMFMAGVFLTFGAFITEDAAKLVFDANAILSVLYLALFGSVVTFTGYYWLMKRLNVVILSLMAFITPIVALLLGWMIVNERISSMDLAGCVFVLIGLVIANLKGLTGIKKEKIIKEVI
ncbi:MAG: EamA family transporter [Ignavibacteriaceae bacterium]